MKTANCIFKLASLVLAATAVICIVLANLERISNWLLSLRGQIATAGGDCCCHCDDADEYEDWDF